MGGLCRGGAFATDEAGDDRFPGPDMKNLLIVYHSMTGGTRQMAEAALRGASAEAAVRMLTAAAAGPADVLAADGYVFATPTWRRWRAR